MAPPGAVPEDERVTDEARILGLLKRLKESRALLSIKVPGAEQSCNSAILELRPDAREMILDEIHPRKGHDRFLQARELRAEGRLKGIHVRFGTTLNANGSHEGIAYYAVAMPSVVHYGQRRANYRAQVGLGLTVPVHLVFDGEKHCVAEGALHDISAGGISMQLKIDLPVEMKEGEVVPACIIPLPTGTTVNAGLEVRFVLRDKERARLRIGGRFVDLDPAQRKAVEHFVAYLDRVVRKKRAAG